MLDLRTLFFVATGALGCVGLLLVVSWLQNRRERTLLWWAIGYGLFAAGLGLTFFRDGLPWLLGYAFANAMVAAGYACNWAGLRLFENRPIDWIPTIAGPLFCLGVFTIPGFADDYRARTLVITGLAALYSFAMVGELWRGRAERLRARPILAFAIGVNAVSNLVRAADTLAQPPELDMLVASQQVVAVTGLVSLLAVITANLLLMAMAKERTTLDMRSLARTDPLTGAMTRGRFYAVAEGMVETARDEARPLTLVLFDLDAFKAINDAAGHAAGDDLLRRFAAAVRRSLARGDAFGRIGGEEFAVLVRGGEDAGLRFADAVRQAYAEAAEGSRGGRATVSAGTASLTIADSFDHLVARADRALYAAKAAGRDRVARDPALSGRPPSPA